VQAVRHTHSVCERARESERERERERDRVKTKNRQYKNHSKRGSWASTI